MLQAIAKFSFEHSKVKMLVFIQLSYSRALYPFKPVRSKTAVKHLGADVYAVLFDCIFCLSRLPFPPSGAGQLSADWRLGGSPAEGKVGRSCRPWLP